MSHDAAAATFKNIQTVLNKTIAQRFNSWCQKAPFI
jgi:hypothetical protein